MEFGDYVAFNNEKGGVIECLKEDSIVDLDSKLPSLSVPEWVSTKAMISTWLAEAVQYELWVASDGSIANKIYFSDLPWPIGKILHWKQTRAVKQLCGITSLNAVEKEAEIYRKANIAYDALSTRLGAQEFLFDSRPTTVDAIFLGHALFVLHALPDTSVLRNSILKHANLVKYAEYLKTDFLEASSSSSIPRSRFDASSSSSMPRKSASSRWRSEPKPKAKRERTEEEKIFRRRAKYFLATQLVAVIVFLSLFGGADGSEDGSEDAGSYEED